MANSTSARKRVRQVARRTSVNVARVSIIRGLLRKVEEAIISGDKKIAQLAFKTMQPKLMSGINAGVVHRNLVARKLSRLSKKIKVMAS